MWRTGNPCVHHWWECKFVQPVGKIVQRFLKKLKMELPYASNSTVCIYLKIMKTLTQKGICTPIFSGALFTIVKIWKQPKCPWMMWNKPVCISDSSLVLFFLTSILPHVCPCDGYIASKHTCGCKNSRAKEKKTWLLIYKICVCLLNSSSFHLTRNNQEKCKNSKVK